MLSKGDKYTVRSLYDLLKKKARTMTRLERLSIGIAIITEGVIIAENSSSLIPKGRLLAYKNYDCLSKLAWGKVAYKVLSKSVQRLSASSWTWESYEVRNFVLAINLWAMSSVPMLGKTLGKPCQETYSADPLCLHGDSTGALTITEVLEWRRKIMWLFTKIYKFIRTVLFRKRFINILLEKGSQARALVKNVKCLDILEYFSFCTFSVTRCLHHSHTSS